MEHRLLEGHNIHVDKLRPPLPYVKGAQLHIRRHVPPPPIGAGYKNTSRRPLDANYQETYMEKYKTHSQLCLSHPPLETPPPAKQTVHRLTIVDQLACGDLRGSQIVTCRINNQQKLRVAKIFDPLYYNFNDGFDPTYFADSHYSCEAAAYMKIYDEGLEGKFTPKYYGSFTFDMPLLDGQKRPVRMVMMEHKPHPSMKALMDAGKVETIPAHLRMRALAQAAEADQWLHFHGVLQNDFFPRNVLVGYQEPAEIESTIIDFSHSKVRDLPNSEWVTRRRQERPISPKESLYGDFGEFYHWVPEDLREKCWEWSVAQWGKSDEFDPPKPRSPLRHYNDDETDD